MVRELTVIGVAYRVLFAVTSYFAIVDLMHHRRGGAKPHTNVQMGVWSVCFHDQPEIIWGYPIGNLLIFFLFFFLLFFNDLDVLNMLWMFS